MCILLELRWFKLSQENGYTVTVWPTHITVTPGSEASDLLDPLLNLLQYEDDSEEGIKTLGYMYGESEDTLYLHKGVNLQYLGKLLQNVTYKYEEPDKSKPMKFEYEEIYPPRNNKQRDIIDFISGVNGHADSAGEHQIFVVADPGFGKAEPYSRKIPCSNSSCGWKLMGDLVPGDIIFDRTGNTTIVTDIFEQGMKDVYKITFEDGRTAECCKDHLWSVKTSQYGFSYKIMNTLEIFDDLMEYQHLYIPRCQPVQYNKKYLPIDPYALGVLLSICRLTAGFLTLTTNNIKVIQKFADIMGYDYRLDMLRDSTYVFMKKGTNEMVTTQDAVYPLYENITMLSNMSIPDLYKTSAVEDRIQLIHGLFDASSISRKDILSYNIAYYSSSIQLVEDIQYILFSLGISSKIKTNVKGDMIYNYIHKLEMCIKHYDYEKIYTTESKNLLKPLQKLEGLKIVSIDIARRQPCRCIKVDNDEHLYLTENFIVTHNTFCASVGLCNRRVKTLIIVHRSSLAEQWIASLINMTGMSSRDIRMLSTEDMYMAAHNKHDFDNDIYIMTHQAFRMALKRIDDIKLSKKIFTNLHIGMKIIDEAHLEFKNTLMIDFITNIDKSLYLTATDGRSDKDQNSIFKHVFANTLFYKPSLLYTENGEPRKWVEYVYVAISTNCSRGIYEHRVDSGLRGMNAATYGRWVIMRDKTQQHFKVCCEILRMIYEQDEQAKVFLFMPLIELCTEMAHYIRMTLNNDESFGLELNVKTIHSKNTKSENENAKRADVIVSTIMSTGTGTDVKGITDIICCSPFSSKITCKQVFGRIRYCGKKCHYFDVVDQSVFKDKIWAHSRMKFFSHYATNVRRMAWTDEDKPNTEQAD